MNLSNFYKKIFFIFFIILHINFCNTNEKNINNKELTTSCLNNNCKIATKTLFIPLSCSQNLYTQYHKQAYEKFNISMTYRFQEAINNNDISLSLFNNNPLVFMGPSIVGETADAQRSSNALIPEYFGLAPDTNTQLYLSPQIRNQILDLQLSFQGTNFWTQVNVPLVKAQWKINNGLIPNNKSVGIIPLENEAQTFIYNIGGTFNSFPSITPPNGNENNNTQYYNILPVLETATEPIKPNYTGAYIVTSIDASENDSYTGRSLLNVSDQNTGSINLSKTIYEEGFSEGSELNEQNWKLDIGNWPTVEYNALKYSAATKSSKDSTVIIPASLDKIQQYNVNGSVFNVNTEDCNVLGVEQNQLNQAKSLTDALSGEYDFNQSLKRLYNNFNFNQDTTTQSWGLADIILWIGYDFCRDTKKNLGLYLHGVIPTGTNINQDWAQYTLNSIIGNGRHFQLGVGLSGGYTFCKNKHSTLTCNIDGYIDHVFATNQFRIFDKLNNPMSRYAIVKSLRYTAASEENLFNDDYEYQNINILGNINNTNLSISNKLKGELIVDFIIENDCFKIGAGYAFSGMSKDEINCNNIPKINIDKQIPNQTYYGYKGDTAISNLIITNITKGEEIFDPTDIALKPCKESPNDTCNYPVACNFTKTQDGKSKIPTPNNVLIKSCGDVSSGGNTGAYLYGESSGGDSNGTEYLGTGPDDVFYLPDILNNESGLIGNQILNKIFGHLEYYWETLYRPTIGIIGSYGFGTQKYFTPLYWDIGMYIGCSF